MRTRSSLVCSGLLCSLFLSLSPRAMADCIHQNQSHPEGDYICHSGVLQECASNNWKTIGSCTRDDQADQKLSAIISDITSKIQQAGLPADTFKGIVLQYSAKIDDSAAASRFAAKQSSEGTASPMTAAPTTASPTAITPTLKFCWIFFSGLNCKWQPC
jgi:hypothetical protein